MNFLSHYYFTQSDHDPYYTLGSILPDLLRNHNNTWKIFPEKEPKKFTNHPQLLSLLKGWKLHLHVDKIFHSSSIFTSTCSNLRKDLVPIFTRLPIRPFFLAHVGYELLLDSLLIQNKEVDTEAFYQELASCEPEIIRKFLRLSGFSEPEGFQVFLDAFIESKYLNSYAQSKNIIYALDQIGRRVWKEPFNQTEKEQATLLFDSIKVALDANYTAIFEEIECSMKR